MSKPDKTETRFFQLVRQWSWLLVLAPLLAGAISYYLNKDEPAVYEAEAQLMIGPGIDSPNPDLNSLRTSGFLMQTYKKLAATDTFLQSVIGDLQVDMTINHLRGMVDLKTDPNSLILTIDVQSEDPKLAISIANAVAKELLNMSPTNPNNPAAIMVVQNRAQASALDETIKQTQAKLLNLESDLQKLDEQANTDNDPRYQNLEATESWVKYLESEFQKLTSIKAQSQMGNQIANELIKNSLQRIVDLESDLHKTDPDLQHLVLTQITAENDHLSALQKTALDIQQNIEGQPLDEYIQSIQANIVDYQNKYSLYFDLTNRKFLSDQIAAERIRLTNAEKIAADRRVAVFFRLSEERGRLSDMKTLPVAESLEKRSLISNQITSESDRLTTLQNSRAAISDALLKSWTNQVQITQLASSTTKVPSNLQLIVLSACIAGFALAVTFVLAIVYFDNTARNVVDMSIEFDIPTLGSIQAFKNINKSQSTNSHQSAIKNLPFSIPADNYRLLVIKMLHRLNVLNSMLLEHDNNRKLKLQRVNGTIVDNSQLPRTILISGMYPESYISEVAANIALVLAQTGDKVLLVDPTIRGTEVSKLLGTDSDLYSLPDDGSPVELLNNPSTKNLYILPTDSILSVPSGLFSTIQTPEAINNLKKYAKYILIVRSQLMSSSLTFNLASCVDGVILVMPEIGLKRDQVDSFIKNATTYTWKIIGTVVVNRHDKLLYLLGQKLVNLSVITRRYLPIMKKESSYQEPNHIEGQSL